jgi:hypothetical protein
MPVKKGNASGAKASASAHRASIPPSVREEVLRKCRRRCCVCFGIRRSLEVKEGQLAHLDRDRTNPNPDNLAFLCLDCHALYDKKSNRVQGYLPGEVRCYRDRLYTLLGSDRVEWTLTITIDRSRYFDARIVVDRAHLLLLEFTREVTLTERPLEQL